VLLSQVIKASRQCAICEQPGHVSAVPDSSRYLPAVQLAHWESDPFEQDSWLVHPVISVQAGQLSDAGRAVVSR
jgi:hypothetical protein